MTSVSSATSASGGASTINAEYAIDFVDPTSDVTRLLTLHRAGRVQCKECNKIYESVDAWEYHYYHYHRKHPNKCDESNCEFTYRYGFNMMVHAHKVHNKRLRSCYICEKTFDDNPFISHKHFRDDHSTQSISHKRNALNCPDRVRHNAEKDQSKEAVLLHYICQKCVKKIGKSFSQYTAFSTIEQLVSHHAIEHVTSPVYPCAVCDCESPIVTEALVHRYTHYKVISPYICQWCSIIFHELQLLDEHNHKFHKVTFLCPKCKHVFIIRQNLRRHIKNNHKDHLSILDALLISR